MERLICIVIGYAFGLFQTGYFVGKAHHMDIRKHGSGNAGSTNALRLLGWKAGATTFFGDSCKCILAVLLVSLLFRKNTEMLPLLRLYAGVGATLGHNFPFYMKFKGGKGIAVMVGMLFATSWWMAVVCLLVFFTVVFFTRYISLGSMLISLLFACLLIVNGQLGGFGDIPTPYLVEIYALGAALMALAWWRHKANIQRLLSGTENKFGNPSKKKAE